MNPLAPTQPSLPTVAPDWARISRFTSQPLANVPLKALAVTTSPEVPGKVNVAGAPAVEMVAATVGALAVIVPVFAYAAVAPRDSEAARARPAAAAGLISDRRLFGRIS